MRSSIRFVALLVFAAGTSAAAQGPGGFGGPGGPARGRAAAPAANLLLAHTGELELSDAQVVRLAAIARRSEARRKGLRAAMDSAGARFGANPADTTGRRQFRARMQADLQRAQDQSRTDQRDAIAVLTPDQQARAWEMVSNRGRAERGGPGQRMPGMREPRMREPRMGEPRMREPRMREQQPMRQRPPRPADG